MLGEKVEVEQPVSAVVPEFTGKMKKKAKVMKKLVPWEPFSYRSREQDNDVLLTHVRPGDDPNRNRNVFLRYNLTADFARYTDSEYASMLAETTGWNREQTDELMRLAALFGARFQIIFDRWNEIEFGVKSVDEIKARFFQIQTVLTGESQLFSANLEQARIQRRHAEILYNRTGHEVWEEFEAQKEFAEVDEELKKSYLAPARVKTLMQAIEMPMKNLSAKIKLEKVKHEAWSPGDSGGAGSGKKSKKNGGNGAISAKKKAKNASNQLSVTNMSSQALATAVDRYLVNLKVPMRPSSHPEASLAHSQLRQQVMMAVDMDVLLQQKLFEVQVLKMQIEALQTL